MTARAKTAEEIRADFLATCRALADSWASPRTKEFPAAPGAVPDWVIEAILRDRLAGFLHSILCIFDGVHGGLPAFDIAASPHPDDKEFHLGEGEDWIEPGTVINDCMLHDLLYREDLGGCGTSMAADEAPGRVAATLERWKHAAGAATAGPWEAHSHLRQYSIWHDELDQPLAREVRTWEDAVFISAARTAMPRLLKAVEDALAHHVPAVIEDGAPPVYPFRYCKTCSGHPAWPCPEVAAITAALTGTQPSEDGSDRA